MRRHGLALSIGLGLAMAVGLGIGFFKPASATDSVPWSLTFAPTDGTGMGVVCGCDAGVTTVEGDPLQFRRTTRAYCTQHDVVSGIANGDLVLCGAGAPRIMPGGDGGGPLGILVEKTATNLFADAGYDYTISPWRAGGRPTLTGNSAVAPDGTTTATKVAFQAATAGASNSELLADVVAGSNYSASVYLKGVSGSGTLDLANWTGSAWQCTACAFNSTTWTRCVRENKTFADYFVVGNASARCGVDRPAQDVYVWGIQLEANKFATSLVPAGVTTRTEDMPYVALTPCDPRTPGYDPTKTLLDPDPNGCPSPGSPPYSFTPRYAGTGRLFSLTATVITPNDLTAGPVAFDYQQASVDAVGLGQIESATGKLSCTYNFHDHGLQTVVHDAGVPTNATTTLSCAWNGTSRSVCVDGTCTNVSGQVKVVGPENVALNIGNQSFSFTGTEDAGYGGFVGGAAINGVVKQLTLSVTRENRFAFAHDNAVTHLFSGNYTTGGYSNTTNRWGDDWNLTDSSQTLAQCQAQWSAYKKSYHSRLIIACGGRDIIADTTGANLWTAMQSFVESVQATGAEVVLLNLTPFKGHTNYSAGRQTQLLAFNSAMSTYCSGHAALKCVDAYATLNNAGDTGALQAAYDSGDHYQLSSAGVAALITATAAVAP